MGTSVAERPPLSGAKLILTAIALAAGTFMQVLDSTIANVSLPTICGHLGVSTENGTWVITAFAVANGVMVPLTGWLMMRFGVVKVFTVSLVTFVIASFLCGLAWSLPTLVAFRILQGAVSGPLIPGSQALLLATFPPHRRGAALTIWSTTSLSAPIFGPLLGGYISDNTYWGWIFFINVPVGLLAAFVTWRNLKDRETPTRKLPVDVVGLGLLAVWVFSLQTMLDLGKDRDWFNDPAIVVLTIVAAVGFSAWVIWELTEKRPAVDLTLFKGRSFAVSTIVLALGYALLFASNVLQPIWLQTQMNYTATWAGLVSAPAGFMAVLLAPVVGRLKVDPRILATISFIAFGLAFLMRSQYTPDAPFWTLAAPLFLQGVAFATFFVPVLQILLDGLPPEKVPLASGLSNFVRITVASFAASFTTTEWDRREAFHQTRLVDAATMKVSVFDQALGGLQHLGLSTSQGAAVITNQIVNQAYLLSALDIFFWSGVAAFICGGLVWLAKRPAPPPSGGGHAVAAD